MESDAEADFSFFSDPDWRSKTPRWLGPDSPAKSLHIDLQRATNALEKLYPLELCRRWIASQDKYRGELSLTLGLYEPGLCFDLYRLLRLGDDLSECVGWDRSRELKQRLRSPREHWQARFEVGLWAGMTRAGVEVRQVPRREGSTTDFLIQEDGLTVALEAKVLGSSDFDRNYRALWDALHYEDLTSTPPHTFVFKPSPNLLSLMNSKPESFAENICSKIRDSIALWYRSNPIVPGAHGQVLSFGEFTLGPAEPGRWGFDPGLKSHGPRDATRRVLPHARKARKQTAAHKADIRAVAVSLSSWTAPVRKAQRELRKLVQGNADDYERLDWIILMNVHADLKPRVEAVPYKIQGLDYDASSLRWFQGLTMWKP